MSVPNPPSQLTGSSPAPSFPALVMCNVASHWSYSPAPTRKVGPLSATAKSKALNLSDADFADRSEKRVGRAMPIDDYVVDMRRVKASQELGIDPVVALPFVIRHSGRSAATVYRDIAAGHLAKAMKRGASSVWSFSAVDAYARGQRPDQLDAHV